jgi:hypothetical protein
VIRLKLLIAGFCALVAGPWLMASGIDGSMARGGLISACGVALIAVVLFSFRHGDATTGKPSAVSRRQNGPEPIEPPAKTFTCQHHWVNPDDPHDMLNDSYLTLRCTECGEERSAWG